VIREQLASGSQVTVTDPDVTRFFMTIEEAVGLVLETARMAEATATYVLDMGEPVRIVELVQNFARLLSIPTIDFRFTGLRPGEKLNEELFGDGEERIPTTHSRISMALPPMRAQGFRARLQDLYDAAAHNRPDECARAADQHKGQVVDAGIEGALARVPGVEQVRADRADDAGQHRAKGERQHLVARRADADCVGGQFILTNSDKRAPNPDALEPGMEMELVLVPFRTDDDGNEVVTFAFRPVP